MTNRQFRIILVNKEILAKLPKSNVLAEIGFQADYKSKALLAELGVVYLGTELKIQKTIDPYYKVIPFELGGSLGSYLYEKKIQNILIEDVESLLSKFEQVQKAEALMDFLLGLKQAYWRFDKYKKTKNKELEVQLSEAYNKLIDGEKSLKLEALDHSMKLTRRLIEETPEAINPASVIDVLQQEFDLHKDRVKVKVHDYHWLKKNKMNGVIMVGKGSAFEPSMIHITIKPKKTAHKKIFLIGKGVTYDTGGYNIKIAGSMLTMKMDMGGSALMAGVTRALADIDLDHTEVNWITAFVENCVSDRSYKPDDIIESHSGQTIEVLNTDAEGRLTLADMLSYATTFEPDYIIDAATLTGASIRALSTNYTSMMSNDQELSDSLFESFLNNGELIQQTPLSECLRDKLKGEITDLINIPRNFLDAGHVTAGLFLSFFVDQVQFRNKDLNIKKTKTYSWAHLDIAGTAYNNKENHLNHFGATAQGLRSLVDWILEEDKSNE